MAVSNASKTVVGVFDQMDDAQTAVRELENSGFARSEISVIANKHVSGYEQATVTDNTPAASEKASNVGTDAGIGAALGGVGGLLLSFAGLAVPGVGPILAVGPIVAALSGAGIGAVAGGIIGALTDSGIPEEEAHYYAEGVRRGHILVTVRTDEAGADRARDVLDNFGAVDVEGRATEWRDRGWSGYNAGAEPLSSDELARERDYYSAANRQAAEWSRTETLRRAPDTDLPRTQWPHTVAHDIGESLPQAEARNAEIVNTPAPSTDASRDTASVVRDVSRPLVSDREYPTHYGDAVENNVRPDPAVVRAERGFERASESAVRSARRMAARVYDTTKR